MVDFFAPKRTRTRCFDWRETRIFLKISTMEEGGRQLKDNKELFCLKRREKERERRARESKAERQERFRADRERVAGRRARESSQERQERLEAERQRNALKRARETPQERKDRLRAQRERAATRRTHETSQDRERRLTALRQRASARRLGETPQDIAHRLQARSDADNRRRCQRAALIEARRNQYLHNRGWADPENTGLHSQEWAQEELAAFHHFEQNLRHCHCVVCKETWPLAVGNQAAEQEFTCTRCKRDKNPCRLYSAENDMDPGSVPAELQGLSEVEELLIAPAFPNMSVYRKHGGQRGYKGHVLNLPQDIQGFLISLPANVSDLPILVIRKQGAGELAFVQLYTPRLHVYCLSKSLPVKCTSLQMHFSVVCSLGHVPSVVFVGIN